jgi:hypothetical protein
VFAERWNKEVVPLLEEARAAGWNDIVQVGTGVRPTPTGAVKRAQPDKWTGKNPVYPPQLWLEDMKACWGTEQETLKRFPLNLAPEPRVRWDALVRSKWGGPGWEERMPWPKALEEFERLEGFDPKAAREEAQRALLTSEIMCTEAAGCQKYVTEFRQKEVFVPDMDEGTKTGLFLMGLQGYPELFKACARQPSGEAWATLSALMEHALAVANTLRAANKGVKRPAAVLAVAEAEEPEKPGDKNGTGALAFARRDDR